MQGDQVAVGVDGCELRRSLVRRDGTARICGMKNARTGHLVGSTTAGFSDVRDSALKKGCGPPSTAVSPSLFGVTEGINSTPNTVSAFSKPASGAVPRRPCRSADCMSPTIPMSTPWGIPIRVSAEDGFPELSHARRTDERVLLELHHLIDEPGGPRRESKSPAGTTIVLSIASNEQNVSTVACGRRTSTTIIPS